MPLLKRFWRVKNNRKRSGVRNAKAEVASALNQPGFLT
jgi:hypothetical protein